MGSLAKKITCLICCHENFGVVYDDLIYLIKKNKNIILIFCIVKLNIVVIFILREQKLKQKDKFPLHQNQLKNNIKKRILKMEKKSFIIFG